MQILSVHNWNCVRCFGNMFNINLKQVILGTRVWSFSYWHQLCSSRRLRLCYGFFVTCLTDPFPESPPLCPGSMLEGDGAAHHASPELGSLQTKPEHAGGVGSCGVICWESQGEGTPACPAHLPTAGMPSWARKSGHTVFIQRSSWPSCLSLISAENVCLGRILKKSKHVVLLPQNIILYICSLQVWDFGSTVNWCTSGPSCWAACMPGNQDSGSSC